MQSEMPNFPSFDLGEALTPFPGVHDGVRFVFVFWSYKHLRFSAAGHFVCCSRRGIEKITNSSLGERFLTAIIDFSWYKGNFCFLIVEHKYLKIVIFHLHLQTKFISLSYAVFLSKVIFMGKKKNVVDFSHSIS